MDDTRPYVDAVDGEPQRAPPGPLTPCLLPALVRDEIGADEGMVLAAQKGCAELARGRLLGAAVVFRGGDGSSAASACTRNHETQQRFEETGDMVDHVINSVCQCR